ncbi:MAG: hypothetical protein J6D53_07645 [Blautia sp.]|nr:hypothetical protein [Blautia sp.]
MSRKIPDGKGRKKPHSLPSNTRKKPVPGRHGVRRPGVELPVVEVIKGVVPEKKNPISIRILGSKRRSGVVKINAKGARIKQRTGFPGSTIRFTPQEILSRYTHSADFRRMVDSDRYIFAEGALVLNSPDYVRLSGGKVRLTDAAKSDLNSVCVRKVPKSSGIRGRTRTRKSIGFREAKKSNLVITVSVGDAVIDGGGPLPPEFPEALSYLMEEKHMTDEGLAALTCLSSKTIWRLRNGKNEPKCPTVIALCIGLSLDPYTGKTLVETARIHLGGGRVDRLYQILLGVAYGITIYEANAFMKEWGCPPLTVNED